MRYILRPIKFSHLQILPTELSLRGRVLADSAQFLDIASFRLTDLSPEARLQIYELSLISPTPLRLNSCEDGWHDPHAESAPILSLLFVNKAVHKEAASPLRKEQVQLSFDSLRT